MIDHQNISSLMIMIYAADIKSNIKEYLLTVKCNHNKFDNYGNIQNLIISRHIMSYDF